MAPMASNPPPRAGPAGSSSGAGFVSRIRWFILAASVAAAGSAGAFLQPVRPDPYASPSARSLDWWFSPLEQNAFKRLPATTGPLNGVHALRKSEHVWVVGDGGLLLHSADGGQSWRQDTIIVPAAGEEATAVDTVAPVKQQEVRDPKKNPIPDRPTQKAPEARPPVQQAPVDTNQYDTVPTPRRRAEKGGLRIAYLPDRLRAMFGQGQNQVPAQTAQVPATPRVAASRVLLDLEDVHFLTPLSGWVVGARGTLASTSDGGSAWTVRQRSPGGRFTQVAFISSLIGGAASEDGVVIGTQDGGEKWGRIPDVGLIRGLETVDSAGFATNSAGILFSDTPVTDFVPVKPGAPVPLNRISFIDSLRGWATDTSARLWSTGSGGRTWTPVDTAAPDRFASIAFASATVGWAVTPAGTLLRTDDGGRNWRWHLGRARLNSVAFRTDREGWAVGDQGLLLHTSDGGRSWKSARLPGEPRLDLIRFVGPDSGSIVDTAGRAWRFHNLAGTETPWVRDTVGAPLGEVAQNFSRLEASVFQSLFRMDSSHVFRVLRDGKVMESRNDGRSWTIAEDATRARIRSMSFTRDSVGWAVSAGGTVLKSVDRGASWSDPAPYKRAPAPWYWLSFLVVGALLTPVMRRPRPPPPSKSVADLLVSDRPIRRGDPDALDLSSVALGLSRFIRNSKTEPPLTIAVTGQWGTGKSSLMNLLQDDLRQYGFRPIWFNAWHHQKEEHLLASLLHRVQTQAVPPLLHRNGPKFRARLLWYRAARFRWAAAILTVLLVASAGYLASDWRKQPGRVFDATKDIVGGIASVFKRDSVLVSPSKGATPSPAAQKSDSITASPKEAEAVPEETLSLLAVLGVLVSTLTTIWKGLRAFGGVPATLMTTVRGAFKLKDLKAQTGFRSQFETEFGEVTSALGAAQMVILIDDLDRCKPENVLEVLEAINFLVSSGACFVVLAMDRDFVEGCVGIGFKHVAEELAEFNEPPTSAVDGKPPAPADSAARGRQIRRDFAVQYLEKLINVEVPVPPASATQLGKIIARPAEIGDLLERQRVRRRRMSLAGRGVLATLAAAALVSLFLWSRHKGNLDLAAARPAVESPDRPPARPPEAVSPPDRVASPGTEPEISPPGDLVPAEQAPLSTSLLIISLILLAVAGLVAILRQPAVTVHDRKEFTEALNVWSPFLYSKRKTPRAIKRFVNRVRLYAMRQQAHLPAETLWDRACGWVSRWPSLSGAVRWVRTDDIAEKVRLAEEGDAEAPEAAAPDKKTIPEDVLVALSSIRECRAEWLQKPELYSDFPEFLEAVDEQDPLPESVQRELADFRRWGSLTPYREKFLRLSDSVRAG